MRIYVSKERVEGLYAYSFKKKTIKEYLGVTGNESIGYHAIDMDEDDVDLHVIGDEDNFSQVYDKKEFGIVVRQDTVDDFYIGINGAYWNLIARCIINDLESFKYIRDINIKDIYNLADRLNHISRYEDTIVYDDLESFGIDAKRLMKYIVAEGISCMDYLRYL